MRDVFRGADVNGKGFLHPREAVAMVMHASGDDREAAIAALAMRLCGGLLVAFVGRVAGHSVPGSAIQPSFNPQIIPAEMWDHPMFCGPHSPIWTIGDATGHVDAGNIHFYNIRLAEQPVIQMVADITGGARNDNEPHVISTQPDPLVEGLATGEPGRPSLGKEIYLAEFKRRIADGEQIGGLNQEAKKLLEWYRREYPKNQHPEWTTVRNRIREAWQSTQNPAQNPVQ